MTYKCDSPDSFELLARGFNEGELIMSSAAKASVLDCSDRTRSMSRQRLAALFQSYGIDCTPRLGRPRSAPAPSSVETLIQMHFVNCLYEATRMWILMQHRVFPVTTTMVERVYHNHNLWQYRVELPGELEPCCRHEADQVNLIWHTDLHQFSGDRSSLLVFFDDASRLLVGAEFLKDE
jgi:hypothetical protein